MIVTTDQARLASEAISVVLELADHNAPIITIGPRKTEAINDLARRIREAGQPPSGYARTMNQSTPASKAE